MSSATEGTAAGERRDALAERLFEAVLGTIDVHMVYLGERLGFYRLSSVAAAVRAASCAQPLL